MFRTALFLALATLLIGGSAHAGPIFTDPIGDTFGTLPRQHDVHSAHAEITATHVRFTFAFTDRIAPQDPNDPESLLGFIDIDRDRNPATGATAADSNFTHSRGAPVGDGLGVEFYVDLSTYNPMTGLADLVDVLGPPPLTPVTGVPVSFGSDFFSVDVPLSYLGDGALNYGALFGTGAEPTDVIRNGGLPPATSVDVPEPSSLILLSLASACLAVVGRRPSRRAPRR